MSIQESALLVQLERRVKELEAKLAWLERELEKRRETLSRPDKRLNVAR